MERQGGKTEKDVRMSMRGGARKYSTCMIARITSAAGIRNGRQREEGAKLMTVMFGERREYRRIRISMTQMIEMIRNSMEGYKTTFV